MRQSPIFSDNFLSRHLPEFKLSGQTGIYRINVEIRSLIAEMESGKIYQLKEEEVKSRFIQTFFEAVLGFNCDDPDEWLLREEKKSEIDGTKPDAALGYFSATKNDVRAIIEIKDARTSLDGEQKRRTRETPIDQAFGYASKMGGNCKWVIVSNMIETRFYFSLDRSKYQVFFLADLKDETKLKELLYLFHKDRFIRGDGFSRTERLYELSKTAASNVDKPLHILDQLYNSLDRFNGFGYVDPNYISTIKPFNILSDYVWHYESRELFTLNPLIYELLKEITVKDGDVDFSDVLSMGIKEENVLDAKGKVVDILRMLQQCYIERISAIKDYQQIARRSIHTIGFSYRVPFSFKEDEGVTKDIQIHHVEMCNCLSCTYRKLDFNKFLSMLKEADGREDSNTMEYAFGHYLAATNNFKTAYNIYQSIAKDAKGKSGKSIVFFLAKLNSQLLYNLVSDYSLSDSKSILDSIKSIDLDRIIHDDLEFEIDQEIRYYLLKVKEDDLIYKLQDQIDDTLEKIRKLKILYERENAHFSGPDYPYKLSDLYIQLYLYVNRNFIIYDSFKRYKVLFKKVFQGLIWSHQTRNVGLATFNSFFLMEAVLHIQTDDLKEIIMDIEDLRVDDESKEDILERLNNFTSSYYKRGIFGDPYPNSVVQEQMHNYRFKDNFTRIFSNLFVIMSKIKYSNVQFEKCKRPLISYLQIEEDLNWHDLRELSRFIKNQPHLFTSAELVELLSISINGDKYGFTKYTGMIEAIPKALLNTYPDFLFDNVNLISVALLKGASSDGHHENYKHLIPLANVCNDECQNLVFEAFEKYLDKKFNPNFYEELLKRTNYDYERKNYFEQYVCYVNTQRGRAYDFGKMKSSDLIFINFALVIYIRNIDFKWAKLNDLTNLTPFEQWLMNPLDFDYEYFDATWLVDLKDFIILDKLKGNEAISIAVDRELNANFQPALAEIKYKFFAPSRV